MSDALLEVEGLRVRFRVPGERQRVLTAVDGVDLTLKPGEFLGLVGESGCGKSTLARSIVGMERRDAGSIRFEGTELATLNGQALRSRRQRIQYIFQDPYSSLSPRHTIRETVDEALRIRGVGERTARDDDVAELLGLVGLTPAFADRYPRALSGGERQRVAIARALTMRPGVLICDEPVSALDVSIRAQVMNVFLDLQSRMEIAFIFISHDLALVRQACDRVAVMYLGKIVETLPAEQLDRCAHPYTQALLDSVPSPDPDLERSRTKVVAEGEPPSPIHPPSGCRFRTRCPIAIPHCADEEPMLRSQRHGGFAACHLAHLNASESGLRQPASDRAGRRGG